MDDPFQNVTIAAGGHRFEEVTGDDFAAIGKTGGFDSRLHSLNHLRRIEEHAFDASVGFENRRNQSAVPTTDIDELLNCRKIIARQNRLVRGSGHSGHRVVKDPGVLRMLCEKLPDVRSEMVIKRNLASPYAVHKIAPGGIVLLAELGHREGAQGAGNSAL